MASQSGISSDENSLVWTKNLSFLPKFTTEQIQKHLEGCSKKDIGSKGYKFFTESYIHDVYVAHDPGARGKTIVKGLCYRSQRKSEEPHKLSLKCESDDNGVANVVQTFCSCKAEWVLNRET